MTRFERPVFAGLMVKLGEIFAEPVSVARIEAYFEILASFEMDAVRDAVSQVTRTLKFFPKPAELLECLQGTPEDAAELAWSELLREIRRVGGWGMPTLSASTAKTMRLLWGSWENVCRTLPGEGPELLGWMKNWRTMYRAIANTIAQPELIGREEARLLLDGLTGRASAEVSQQLPPAYRRALPTVQERPEVAGDVHAKGRAV